MPDQIVTETGAALRAAANFIEVHPHLPVPYVTTSSDGRAQLHWFLHLDAYELAAIDQHAIALGVFDAVGGLWTQGRSTDSQDLPTITWDNQVDELRFHVAVRCESQEPPC